MKSFVIKRPIITEKSLSLAKNENKYVFEVARTANKNQISTALKEIYPVDIVSINTIRGYRVRKTTGRKRMKSILAPTKKAIIQLKKGQTIDLFEFGEKNQ